LSPSAATLPNGIVTEYGYDDASRLTSLTYKQGGNVIGNSLMNTTKMAGRDRWATALPEVSLRKRSHPRLTTPLISNLSATYFRRPEASDFE